MPLILSPSLPPQRAHNLFLLFRGLLLALLLLLSLLHDDSGRALVLGGTDFLLWAGVYGVLIAAAALAPLLRLPTTALLPLAMGLDIVMLVLLVHLSGGVKNGFGLLLLPLLALAGLLVSRRMAWFYAALATLGLLTGAADRLLRHDAGSSELFQSGLLALACFFTVSVTYELARLARQSERLAAERGDALENMHQLNSLVLQALRESVIVVDDGGVVRQFNEQAEQLFPALRRGTLQPTLANVLRRWQTQGQGDEPMDVECRAAGRLQQGRLVPLKVRGGRVLVLFLRDAADLADEARRSKLAALGRLTANIAHEVRNPLSAISHAGELLRELHDDDASQRLLAIVGDNSRRIDHLVQEVQALGRRDRVRRETIELAPFLHTLMSEFSLSHQLPLGGLRLEGPDMKIEFDRSHLQQIVGNLIANAWRHSSRMPGSVRLLLAANEHGARLSVIDDGPGVPTGKQPHLFEPFFTTETQGTGLGLYIARELAEANGAQLDYLPPGGHFSLSCPTR